MSRIEAALRRAATGAVDERAPGVAVAPVEGVDDLPIESTPVRAIELPESFETLESPDSLDSLKHETQLVPRRAVATKPRGTNGSKPQRSRHESPVVEAEPAAEAAPRFRAFSSKDAEKIGVAPAMPQSLREHYRRLAATLHHAQAESGVKVLMVSSAVPDEGKTLTATNLALTLSESYQRRVLLIDADLRRPSLDGIFQLPKVFGLNEALTSMPERKVSVVQISSHLSLLTAGAPDPDPMSTLTSERMRRLLREAAAAFEWVIIDTPPVGILTDAKLLGSMVDAALLVIRAGKTPSQLIQRSVDAIGRERILGVVLNRTDPRSVGHGYYYYDSYYYGKRK